jgi:uncharacterized protein (TIGR02246 family)
MRKERVCILVLILLALAAPCFAQAGPEHQPNSIKPPQTTATPAPAKKMASKSMSSNAADDIEAKERQVLAALQKGDLQAFGSLLADDAMEVTEHGVLSKAQILEGMKGATLSDFTMTDVKVTAIDKDASLITYRTGGKFSAHGQAGTYDDWASTVWVKRGGKWLAFIHQETPVMAHQ